MTDGPDDLDKLLTDVRKTICDNKQFLEKLADVTAEDGFSAEETETVTAEDEFEEL